MAQDQILIFHHGRQHSHRAALGLHQYGLLDLYLTGIPCLKRHRGIIPHALWDRVIRYQLLDLPESKVVWNPISPIINKIAFAFFSQKSDRRYDLEYWGYRLFDKWVASLLPKIKVKAVIGYENACLETFKQAKKMGIITILDAASLHHTVQDKHSTYLESQEKHKRITSLKDQEVHLADFVFTVSQLAKESYENAGVPSNKIWTLSLGVDLDLFQDTFLKRPNDDYVNFIFSGSALSIRKGLDYLVNAFEAAAALVPNIRLRLVGSPGDGLYMIKQSKYARCFQFLGQKKHNDLVKEYQDADCFILPSRHESYGMVVAESLACGTPVIVSDMVGAKDLIKEGENGWVIPLNKMDTLSQRILWCAQNKKKLLEMRRAARNSVSDISWQNYYRRINSAVSEVLGLSGI